jgi:hypothetical protein
MTAPAKTRFVFHSEEKPGVLVARDALDSDEQSSAVLSGILGRLGCLGASSGFQNSFSPQEDEDNSN